MNRARPYYEAIEEILLSVRDGSRQALVSVVTEIELLVRPIREGDVPEHERIGALLNGQGLDVIDLDRREIGPLTAKLRASYRLTLADAAIVATGIVTGCDAIVGNDERCAQRVREIPYILLDALVKET